MNTEKTICTIALKKVEGEIVLSIKAVVICIAIIATLIVGVIIAMHSSSNKVEVMGMQAYYTESVNKAGFIRRRYYEKGTNRTIGESFGYSIMDDIADIDGDGITELLCTCTYDDDEGVCLYVYKADGNRILCGSFSPYRLGLTDYSNYGSGSFITYYYPSTAEILAQYTTPTGCNFIKLSIEQIIYTPFISQ